MVFVIEVCEWNSQKLVSQTYIKLPKENYRSIYEDTLQLYSNREFELGFYYDLDDAMLKDDLNQYSYPLCVGKNDELTINISLIYQPFE